MNTKYLLPERGIEGHVDVEIIPVFRPVYQHFTEASKKVTPSLDSILAFLDEFESHPAIRFIASTSSRQIVARIRGGNSGIISNLNCCKDGLYVYTFDSLQFDGPAIPSDWDPNWKPAIQDVCPAKNKDIMAGVLDYIRFAPFDMPYAEFLSKQGPVIG
jgi:hypothetical protein